MSSGGSSGSDFKDLRKNSRRGSETVSLTFAKSLEV